MKPLITNYTDPKTGKTVRFEYHPTDSFDDIDPKMVRQIYGVCFFENKMVVVRTDSAWILPGGSPEKGETFEQTLKREIIEETNMEVLDWRPLGVQTVYEKDKEPYCQLRAVCKVRPLGPFVSDPDGDIIEIKLIEPSEYKKYFDWGEIGDAIISKALEIRW